MNIKNIEIWFVKGRTPYSNEEIEHIDGIFSSKEKAQAYLDSNECYIVCGYVDGPYFFNE